MNGKGDKNRVKNKKQFDENFSLINWGHDKPEEKPADKTPELINTEVISFD